MARQATTPVQFNRTTRTDQSVTMTSGRAGKVVPVGYIPLLRGDSASGRVGIDLDLAEMPKPLLNAVTANFQAWFVPKSAHPQFSGLDEFMHSYQGEQIKALGQADRNPPNFYEVVEASADKEALANSELYKTLGLHILTGVGDASPNADLVDAFNLIYNFRLAAHSSRLQRREYARENLENSVKLPPAFWPSSRLSRIVPDYERALIVGALDLDVLAGEVPLALTGTVDGLGTTGATLSARDVYTADGTQLPVGPDWRHMVAEIQGTGFIAPTVDATGTGDLSGQSIGITLADIDKARTTQAFAKLRTAYAGNDATGFDNDDVLVAELMQGFRVPDEQFKRPWLLDSKRVVVGMAERPATDGPNLDKSVTQGRASALLSLNVPQNDVGGVILITVEVVPERIDERMGDDWLHITDTAELPNALRDVQRPEPVDMVTNSRVDAKHTSPQALYGYEPMNDRWNRDYTRLGGAYYQADPSNPWTEQRSAIWQTSIVDPEFTENHYVVPEDFPHDVFSDRLADAFEVVARHQLAIVGLTQIGDVLAENNDDYAAVTDQTPEE